MNTTTALAPVAALVALVARYLAVGTPAAFREAVRVLREVERTAHVAACEAYVARGEEALSAWSHTRHLAGLAIVRAGDGATPLAEVHALACWLRWMERGEVEASRARRAHRKARHEAAQEAAEVAAYAPGLRRLAGRSARVAEVSAWI